MRQQLIYEVNLVSTGSINELRKRMPSAVFFSNLKKTIESVSDELRLNGWDVSFNYTSVYRSIKSRGKFFVDYEIAGNRVFRIVIQTRYLNPVLPQLGVEEKPRY